MSSEAGDAGKLPATARTTIDLPAGVKTSGEMVREEVLVDRIDESTFRVVATPGVAAGIARGDLIYWEGGYQEPEVIERGGYVAVQVYGPPQAADSIRDDVVQLGGCLDGRASGGTITSAIYSIPVSVGFPRIEELMAVLAARHPGIEWYYGNVYADDGVTPLNWWPWSTTRPLRG